MAAVEPHNPYAVTAQGRAAVRPTSNRRRQVVTLGAACALPSSISVAIGSAVQHVEPGGRVLGFLHLVVTLAVVIPAYFVSVHALQPPGGASCWYPRRWRSTSPLPTGWPSCCPSARAC
jgi:hypothetical protein